MYSKIGMMRFYSTSAPTGPLLMAFWIDATAPSIVQCVHRNRVQRCAVENLANAENFANAEDITDAEDLGSQPTLTAIIVASS